ncbi:MAG: glucosamine-6-phosphate deaminase [Candidatus Coproplasma sp.]
MKIIVVENYEEMSERGAEIIAEVVKSTPNATLGLATGSTPIGLYKKLISEYEQGEISFKEISTVNLDEYIGLDGENNQSYRYFMNTQLFNHVDIDKANTHVPSGVAEDMGKECERYTQIIRDNPQVIQLLGLGSDGHIGFNEPGSPFDGHTHIVELEESTIKDNARLFDRIEDVPKSAITMGIADVMQAKRVLLIANGANKAEAVKAMIQGEVTEACPASILQRHSNVTVIIDKEAAKLL